MTNNAVVAYRVPAMEIKAIKEIAAQLQERQTPEHQQYLGKLINTMLERAEPIEEAKMVQSTVESVESREQV